MRSFHDAFVLQHCKVFHLIHLGNRIQIAHLKRKKLPYFYAKLCLPIGYLIITQSRFSTIHLMPDVSVDKNNYTHDICTLYQLGLKISISILLTSRQYSYNVICKITFWLYSEHIELEYSSQAASYRWVRTYLSAEHVCQLYENGMYKV